MRGCLCGVSCFPGFDRLEPLTAEGFDWPHVAAHMLSAIDALLSRSSCNLSQVTLVLHDWGCVAGLWFAKVHPGKVKRVALFDVGPTYSRSLKEKFKHAIPAVVKKAY